MSPDPVPSQADPEVGMSRDRWLESFSELLGVRAPGPDEVEALLAIAGRAAHESERTAAPIACYLVGCSEIDPAAVLATLETVRSGPG
ncbi:MAG: DUF6457 domain-containing protein [Acidimicrobiales bacterium]